MSNQKCHVELRVESKGWKKNLQFFWGLFPALPPVVSYCSSQGSISSQIKGMRALSLWSFPYLTSYV